MSLSKGWLGEKKVAFYMWLWLPKKTYHKFHDLIIPSTNGTSQIDHIVISIYGIFIVETKNKRGWIFGSEKNSSWTQSIYGNNYSFQNPLRQTFRQKKALSIYLNIEESKIHTIAYFVGNCEFKTEMPKNVINGKLCRFIKKSQRPILMFEEVDELVARVKWHERESTLTIKDHIKSLEARHSSNSTCPKCGSKLVQRVSRKGPNKGSRFLGCDSFPKCRYSTSIQTNFP